VSSLRRIKARREALPAERGARSGKRGAALLCAEGYASAYPLGLTHDDDERVQYAQCAPQKMPYLEEKN